MAKENEKLIEGAEPNIEVSKGIKLSEEQLNHVIGGVVEYNGKMYWCHGADPDDARYCNIYYKQGSANGCYSFKAKSKHGKYACTNCKHFVPADWLND